MSPIFQLLRQPRTWLLVAAIACLAGGILALNFTALAPTPSHQESQLTDQESFAVPSRRVTVEVRNKNTGEVSRRHIFDISNVEVETQIGFVNGDTGVVLWDKEKLVQTYTRRSRDGKQLEQLVTPIDSPHFKREVTVPFVSPRARRFATTSLITSLFDRNGVLLERYTHRTDGTREVSSHLPDGKVLRKRLFAETGLLSRDNVWSADGKRLIYEAEYRKDGTLETEVEFNDGGSDILRMYWPDGKNLFAVTLDTSRSTDISYFRLDGSKWVRNYYNYDQPSTPNAARSYIEVYYPNGEISVKLDWGYSDNDLTASIYREDGTLSMRYRLKAPASDGFRQWKGKDVTMKETEVFDGSGRRTQLVVFNEKGDAPASITNFKWDGSGVKRSLVPAETGSSFVRVEELDAAGKVLLTADTDQTSLETLDQTWLLPPVLTHPDRELQKAEQAAKEAAGK